MSLSQLQITCLRNIQTARLVLHPGINLFVGNNGSGKTSLLEAIYLLSTGNSFRTREISPLISHQHDALIIYGKTSSDDSISIQKSLKQATIARLNGETCYSRSELASFLPTQVFYQTIFQIFDAGPVVRREILDWGVFHYQSAYHAVWKNYRRTLKHRNSLLRQGMSYSHCIPFDKVLTELAAQLDHFRQMYFDQLAPIFASIVLQLSDIPCQLHYYRGWDRRNEGKSLFSLLASSFDADSSRQFTQYGAHQADLSIDCLDKKLKHVLSRGQQKTILIALKFAQAALLSHHCVFLMDDLCAELDEQHVSLIVQHLKRLPGQCFITVRPHDVALLRFESTEHTLFHIANGQFNS